MPRQQRPPASSPTVQPPAKRRGCLYYAGMGLLAFLALGVCGALANIFSNDTPASPERAAIVDVSQETPIPTPAPPTATNAPPTATNAPPTATSAPPTATNAPPTATNAPPTATNAPPTATNAPPTATSAPPPVAELVEATANTNANLREGPGTDYPVIGSTVVGQALQPVGRNSAGDWLQLASGAWIAAALVDNPPAQLPVTAVAAVLPGGNPTPAPEGAPTPSWRQTVNGIEFASDCPCDQGNILNCGDFGISMNAQACYLRCMELAGFDVHDMDRDNDGSACEWNW